MDEVFDPLEVWDLSSPINRTELRDIQASYYRSMLGVELEDKLDAQVEFLDDTIEKIREVDSNENAPNSPEGVVLRLDTLKQITLAVKQQKFTNGESSETS